MKVVVTGGNGFVGGHLIAALGTSGHEVVGTVRRPRGDHVAGNLMVLSDVDSHREILRGAEVLVHTAGLAHRPSAQREEFERVNRDWTIRLAAEASAEGVGTVIALSSIAARETEAGRETPYGRSKLDAEPAVEALGKAGIMGINLRPPLIYGPGAPGNWSKLVALADSPWPLPFRSVRNRRSYLFIENLVGAVLSVIRNPDPNRSGTYELADRERVSLAEVVGSIRSGLGRPSRLVPFPVSLMEMPLRMSGKNAFADGLFADLAVDPAPFQASFGWAPALSTLAAMSASVVAP